MSADRQAGFTLVEMLVALFALSLIAAAGMAMLSQTLSAKQRVGERVEMLRQVDLARAVLKADIGQAAARPARGLYGAGDGLFFDGGLRADGEGEQVLFMVRRGWENPGALERRGSLQAVEYRLEEGALVRIARVRPDATPQTPERRRVLLTGIESLSVEFARGGQWSSDWRGGPRAAPQLPEIVRLTVTLEGAGEIDQLFMTGAAF